MIIRKRKSDCSARYLHKEVTFVLSLGNDIWNRFLYANLIDVKPSQYRLPLIPQKEKQTLEKLILTFIFQFFVCDFQFCVKMNWFSLIVNSHAYCFSYNWNSVQFTQWWMKLKKKKKISRRSEQWMKELFLQTFSPISSRNCQEISLVFSPYLHIFIRLFIYFCFCNDCIE